MKIPAHQSFMNKLSLALIAIAVVACKDHHTDVLAVNDSDTATVTTEATEYRNLSQEFKDYWYAGQAELTSYDLVQERYGELREGTAVNIFVTEDFLPDVQVKADGYAESNIPVLKLNNTKKFLTGLYPYSIMTSSFVPVDRKDHAIKVTHSMQEWCGHVYVQLNNRSDYEIKAHSYFEGEADASISVEKTWLENEIWNLIRINPDELPTGTFTMVPSFEYSRFKHKKIDAYNAEAELSAGNDNLSTYQINYPDLNRTLAIHFSTEFPYEIEGWTETTLSRGPNPKELTTTATKKERILSPYWTKNGVEDEALRESLGLE